MGELKLAFYFVNEVIVLIGGKGTAVLLISVLLFSGCRGEEKSRSEVMAVNAEKTEVSMKQTKITSVITHVISETFSEEIESSESTENESEFENFKENVVVIGDSIALGYGAYERLPMNHVFARLNASPSKMDDFKFEYAGGEAPALTILNDLQPDFVMLSMGLNDIPTYSAENFAEKYKGFADEVLKVCPHTKIYIMGLSPVMSECEYTTNNKIDEYNSKLDELFENYNQNIYFVNAGTVLKNDNGSLNKEYSSGDGIHLTGAAYDEMLEELENYLYE